MRKVIPVVAGLIIKVDGIKEVLLKYRAVDESPEAEQNWELPGGVIKYREDPEQALEREIREELGIIVSVDRLLHAQSNVYSSGKHYLILYYECHTNYHAELDGCRWVRADDVEELPTLPGTREALNAYNSRYPQRRGHED